MTASMLSASARHPGDDTPILTVDNVCLRFGGLTALDQVSFRIAPGEIVSLIGPNGAGKTSQFNVITGHCRPASGRVLIAGRVAAAAVTWRTWAIIAASAVAAGVFAVLALNPLDLWQRAILDHFRYRQPFPWGSALASLATALSPARPWVLVPFVIGAALGAAGAFSTWRRARDGAERVARAGVGRTFQNIRLFAALSARDNVLVGMDARLRCGALAALLHLPHQRREEASARARADELLAFVGLDGAADAPAGSLPYGRQRRLEIARALAGAPALLLLDEPAAGMNPVESQSLMELIRRIRAGGTTVLLIEHDMNVVMGISDRVIVLDYGRCIADGTPAAVRADPTVIAAYLGSGA